MSATAVMQKALDVAEHTFGQEASCDCPVVFGTMAICIYPLLYRWNQHWLLMGANPAQFGIDIGSTMHEIAQVIAVSKSIDQEVTHTAMIAKMIRIMMLAPALMLLSALLSNDRQRHTEKPLHRQTSPPRAKAGFRFP